MPRCRHDDRPTQQLLRQGRQTPVWRAWCRWAMPSSARSTAVWRAAPADAGLHSEPAGGLIKLWWLDRTHASL